MSKPIIMDRVDRLLRAYRHAAHDHRCAMHAAPSDRRPRADSSQRRSLALEPGGFSALDGAGAPAGSNRFKSGQVLEPHPRAPGVRLAQRSLRAQRARRIQPSAHSAARRAEVLELGRSRTAGARNHLITGPHCPARSPHDFPLIWLRIAHQRAVRVERIGYQSRTAGARCSEGQRR